MSDLPLIVPEILIIDKLEETEKKLPPALWENMRQEAIAEEQNIVEDRVGEPLAHHRRRVFMRDFVDKVINLPLELQPYCSEEIPYHLHRLHMFCCQRAIHEPEVRRNPFILHFRALVEMKEALIGFMLSYRLIHPSAPYKWSRDFFEKNIIVDTGQDGHPLVKMNFATPEIITEAIDEEIVTDWMIYRAYDNNGIRTLSDIKNNLIDLPDYKRGGSPASEFSRFERKMREKLNRIEEHKNQELELEYRKTLVRNVAQMTVQELIESGMSQQEILQYAFNTDFKQMLNPSKKKSKTPQITNKSKPKAQSISDEFSIDNLLAKYDN